MTSSTRPAPPAERIDGAALVRGASRAFTILALGGVVQPVVGAAVPALGYVWLVLVAVAAFAAAGSMRSDATAPHLQGAAAALGGYALIVPVVIMATGGLLVQQAVLTALTAVVVGGLAGWSAARRQERSAA